MFDSIAPLPANGLARCTGLGRIRPRRLGVWLLLVVAWTGVSPFAFGGDYADVKATSDPHWSFEKPVRPPVPDQAASASSNRLLESPNPIDRLLAAEQLQRGLVPTGPAANGVLLRRLYLDLIGLPPTRAEVQTFLSDQSPGAYERVVDRLLDSPQYGERWARHWMDVWRYSDWDGFGSAVVYESKPHIWHWRDWTIESLNSDKPYDRMVTEMLAADEIAPLDLSAARAGGFLARNWHKANRNVSLEATVEHVGKAFLGITLNCARCHDHKFDPISQAEYYQFRAFFEPYDVRTDRLPGEIDTKRDALVRVYDAHPEAPTFLFVHGNEATPDKAHPMAPAVPRALGNEDLAIEPASLPLAMYSPGSQQSVQRDLLTQASAQVERVESRLVQVNAATAEAHKKLANFLTARSSTQPVSQRSSDIQAAGALTKQDAAIQESGLRAAAASGERTAKLTEQEMIVARANVIAVRAAIDAETAARADLPADNACQLAREAHRCQRVFEVQHAKHNVMCLESEMVEANANAAAGDEAAKKKLFELYLQSVEAQKMRDAAQAALGQVSETYAVFGRDFRCTAAPPGVNDEPCTQLGPIYPKESTGRRAALARWIVSKNNPLTARVAVNHIWLRHFGSPLVPTVFDFGRSGKHPSHPALLDWLAIELMDQQWKMKAIHRLIVTSAAYRMQSTSNNTTNRERDPENVFLWRMNPRRMEAETVRDSILQIAGMLDGTMFGPELDENQGMSVPRRSIYFRVSKEKKVTFLDLFDGPNVTDCYRRSETIVPQQALAMANSSLARASARRLARSLAKEAKAQVMPEGQSAFVEAAFQSILCRPPTREETGACLEFLRRQARELSDPGLRVAFASAEENAIKPSADPIQRAREDLIHVLVNHNDFVTIR